MIYNFSDMKKQNEFIEDKLQQLKQEYQKPQMTQEQLNELQKTMRQVRKDEKKAHFTRNCLKYTTGVAILLAAFIILPNTSVSVAHAMEQIPIIGRLVDVVVFRDYKYESDRNRAVIEVAKINLEEQITDAEIKRNLKVAADEINREIESITNGLVQQFEEGLKDEEGYQDTIVTSEVLKTTADYFVLKLLCYQGSGSGYQWNYYYTIDLKTGNRLQLKDIFVEGADYITPISENIKEQMQQQMNSDEQVHYWLNDEIEELNFRSITDETSFYMNERGNVVIGFNEGDVAPMYMGALEFEIPAETVKDILK